METPAKKYPWVLRSHCKRLARSSDVETTRERKFRARKTKNPRTTFFMLPLDAHLEILGYLGPRDLLVLRRVSVEFADILQNPLVWKSYEVIFFKIHTIFTKLS